MIEFILGTWFAWVLRVVGVCVLFVMGHIMKFFRPSSVAYSFQTIYGLDHDKNDSYKKMMDRTGQLITGALFLGVLLFFPGYTINS